jgi:hypothetical protein
MTPKAVALKYFLGIFILLLSLLSVIFVGMYLSASFVAWKWIPISPIFPLIRLVVVVAIPMSAIFALVEKDIPNHDA